MIKTFFSFLALGFSTLVISSCCKNVQCAPGYATLAFVGFDLNDTELFYVRRYQQNSGFSAKIDTVVLRKEDLFYRFKQDTVFISVNEGVPMPAGKYFITGGYDYEIVLPATRQVFGLTELREINKEEKICGMRKRLCNTVVNSVKVDGINYADNAVLKR